MNIITLVLDFFYEIFYGWNKRALDYYSYTASATL